MPFWGRLNLLYPIGAKITGTNKKEHKTAEIKLGKESRKTLNVLYQGQLKILNIYSKNTIEIFFYSRKIKPQAAYRFIHFN